MLDANTLNKLNDYLANKDKNLYNQLVHKGYFTGIYNSITFKANNMYTVMSSSILALKKSDMEIK